MDEQISNNINADVLADKIKQGLATKEERGIALKTINTQLAIDLVSSLDDIKGYVSKLKNVRDKVRDKMVEKLDFALECDELSLDDLFKYSNSIIANEMRITEMYRQVIQGNRMLFDEDSLSEEDRTLLRVLRSFATEDDKKEFFDIVNRYYEKRNSDNEHIEEANVVE
jgi:hypothetical protein